MIRDKWKSFSKLRKRLFAAALAFAVLSTSISIGSFAVNAETSKEGMVITSFATLPDEVAYQEVPVGGSEADILFPHELDVVIYSEKETEENGPDEKDEPVSEIIQEPVITGTPEPTEEPEPSEPEVPKEEAVSTTDEEQTPPEVTEPVTEQTPPEETEPVTEQTPSEETEQVTEQTPTEEAEPVTEPSPVVDSETGDTSLPEEPVSQEETPSKEENQSPEVTGSLENVSDMIGSLFLHKVYAAELENEDEEVKELSSGVQKTLSGVRWVLSEEESEYGATFTASRAGDVFVYVPVISDFDLNTEAPLPRIRVTIVESADEEIEEDPSVSDNEIEKKEEFSQLMIVGGVHIELTAVEGVFPEGAMLVVKKVESEADNRRIEEVIMSDMGTEDVPELLSFDIHVIDNNGEEIQPNTEYGQAKITFSNIGIMNDEDSKGSLSVYHFDEGLSGAVSLGANMDASGGTAEVMADHLSVFTLALVEDTVEPGFDGVSVTDIVCKAGELKIDPGKTYTFGTGSALGAEFYVEPENATNKTIEWSLKDGDGKVVSYSMGGSFTAPTDSEPSYYTLTATIKNGDLSGEKPADFVKTYPVICTDCVLQVLDHSYYTMQGSDAMDAYVNVSSEITISGGEAQYLILDAFTSSVDALKNKTWSDYIEFSKPSLYKNQLNYVYARVETSEDSDSYVYISSRGIWEDEVKPEIQDVSASLNGTKANVTVNGNDEHSGIDGYFVLAKKSNETAPSAEEIIQDGTVTTSGEVTLEGLSSNTSYIFYAVAADKAGNISDVQSSDMQGSASLVIKVEDKSFKTMQGKNVIAACYNEQKEITISVTTKGIAADNIQYYISDTFYSSTIALEKAAADWWSTYNTKSKPALLRNQINYIYAKLVSGNGSKSSCYISSQGIWEDEIVPKVTSVKGTPKDTSAAVVVKGTDSESGIADYYMMIKKKDESVPKPSEVKSGGKENKEGLFAVTGLTAKTDYVIYGVIEDKAGNLSDVKSSKLTTKESSSSSGSSSNSKTAAGGSSAGAGGAGAGGTAGSGSLTPGMSNADQRIADALQNNGAAGVNDENGMIRDRVPYIMDASEGILIGRELTSGWDRIERETAGCMAPAEIFIDMNGSTIVPGGMLHAFSERDVTCYFKMDETITWVVNGLSFTDLTERNIDLRVRQDTKNIPAQKINAIADVYPHINLTLSHEGDFGFTALMRLNAGAANAELYANLYYYRPDSQNLEYVNSSSIDKNGAAVFEFTHASDYTVIIRGDALTGTTSVLNSEKGEESKENIIHSETMVKKTDNRLWLIIISALSVIMCLIILFAPDNNSKRKYRGRA